MNVHRYADFFAFEADKEASALLGHKTKATVGAEAEVSGLNLQICLRPWNRSQQIRLHVRPERQQSAIFSISGANAANDNFNENKRFCTSCVELIHIVET
jgi:hypothetical protein